MDHCRADFRHFISIGDLEFYDSLPDLVEVYRGCSADRVYGLSWTKDLEVAESFARGHRGIRHEYPVIAYGTVRKKDILFATNDRKEFEVLADEVSFSFSDFVESDQIATPSLLIA